MPLRIYESSEKRGGEAGIFRTVLVSRSKEKEKREGLLVLRLLVAVVRFVRLLMRACVAAACGRNGDEALKWQMFPLPYLRPPHTACLVLVSVRILVEKCCRANLAYEKYDQGSTRFLKSMRNNPTPSETRRGPCHNGLTK